MFKLIWRNSLSASEAGTLQELVEPPCSQRFWKQVGMVRTQQKSYALISPAENVMRIPVPGTFFVSDNSEEQFHIVVTIEEIPDQTEIRY